MDETTKLLIDQVATKVDGKTSYKLSELAPSELIRLAAVAVGHLAPDIFDVAVGIAYSGILFAAGVSAGRRVAILTESGDIYGPDISGQKVALVQDIATRSGDLKAALEILKLRGAEVVGIALVIDLSRSEITRTLSLPVWSAYQPEEAQ